MTLRLFLAVFLVTTSIARSADFIRGDANIDGKVSISDGHFILNFLFRGGRGPDCMAAFDANGDGAPDLTDAIYILDHIFLGGAAPPLPYPSAGPGGGDLGCGIYGSGTPLEDPAARLTIENATAAGGTQTTVALLLGLASSRPLGGYSAVIGIQGGAIESVMASQDLTGTLENGFLAARVSGDKLLVGFLTSLMRPNTIAAAGERSVLRIDACLPAGLPAGEYSLTIESGELTDAETGRAIDPVVESATLRVLETVAVGARCGPSEPVIERPDQMRILFEVRNEGALFPLHVRSNAPAQGVSFSIDFDEEQLTLLEVRKVFQRADGKDWDSFEHTVNNSNDAPGPDPGEGYVAGVAMVGETELGSFRAGGHDLVELRFQLKQPPTGGCAVIAFEDGGVLDPGGANEPVRNAVLALGQTVTPENAGRFEMRGFSIETGFVTNPGDINAEYRLSDARSLPGNPIAVPLTLLANAGIQGFSYSVDFEEDVLQGDAVEILYERPDGQRLDFEKHHIDNSRNALGSEGVDEGYVAGGVVFDFTDDCSAVPANTPTDVLAFHFLVNPNTTATVTELRFIDGGRFPQGAGLSNIVTIGGTNVEPEAANSFIFTSGLIHIGPDIAVFIRGDSNGDEAIDISDAQNTLGYLFLGSGPPACFDAADANDDGGIDISDAVETLSHLFLGVAGLPPPYPGEGEDPTEDGMGCLLRS